jgi:HK97 family phage portal protein
MAFVMTQGQLTAVEPASVLSGWDTNLPSYLQMADSHWMTYAEIYRTQPAVRTVVEFLSRNIASLGLDVYHRIDDNDREKDVRHALARLLERPWPGTKWNKYKLLHWTVSEFSIYNCAYWLKGKNTDGDMALMPIPRARMQPIGRNPLSPEGYRLFGNRGQRDVGADEVVHFYGYAPEDPRNGVPPIEALRQVLAEEYAASQWREQMWRNGARLGGVITRPKDAPKWKDDARRRFSEEWRAFYSGDGPEAGGTAVLEEGMDYKATGMTPRDAQYIESRKLTLREVAIAYHINPMMIGIMDEGTTKGSVQELHTHLYQDTLGPYLAMFAQDIETQLLPDLDMLGSVDGSVYVEFNIESKLRGSFEAQVAAVQAAVGGPYMTRSEARARFNLPHLDEADELIVPLNVVAGGLANPRDTAPDNPANEESNSQPPAPQPAV